MISYLSHIQKPTNGSGVTSYLRACYIIHNVATAFLSLYFDSFAGESVFLWFVRVLKSKRRPVYSILLLPFAHKYEFYYFPSPN